MDLADKSDVFAPYEWSEPDNAILQECPFPPSRLFSGVRWTGRFVNYTNGDTWYPTWGEDDLLYSPWTDGYLKKVDGYEPFDDAHPAYACNSLDYLGRKAATAQATIEGDDPFSLRIVNLSPRIEASPVPYGGRYPCGSLIHEGVWYYGTYCLRNREDTDCGGVGWTEMGPFVGFRTSTDQGKSWSECPWTPESPIFGENPDVSPVKIGAPHVVDFGKGMMHSPDGYAYLVAHGSSRQGAWNNWIQGDEIYLLRTKPSLQTIHKREAWEFFAGHSEKGKSLWTRDFSEIQPLLSWPDRLGCVTVTWNPALQRYLMWSSRGTSARSGDTMLLEAETLTGEWRLVSYLQDFGPFAYFCNTPSKWISANGRTSWLCLSANWAEKASPGHPRGAHYSLSLHEMELKLVGEES